MFWQTGLLLSSAVLLAVAATPRQAISAELGGTYHCEPQPRECRSNDKFIVIASGNSVEIESAGNRLDAKPISDITLSLGAPWNMLGVVYGDSIEWSDGTRWRKE